MRPETENELADAIKGAAGPLRISGGGTRDIGNPVVGEALSTAGLSGITLYEPGALTIVARAGTPVSEIEAALEGENQRLAFEPMDHRRLLGRTGTPTIGGVVAGNVSGPRRISVGACRDHLLGVRFVDGAGTVIKNGGRVMKNVTGYDLVKLMAGSYGTLGVLSEVSLKVLPKPETAATVTVGDLTLKGAVAAMSAALGSPYEVTGAVMDISGAVHLRLEGFAASVAYRAQQLRDVMVPFGAVEVGAAQDDVWQGFRDVAAFADRDVVVRVSVKPSGLAALIEGARLAGQSAFEVMADWGGGLVWIGADAQGGAELVTHLQNHCATHGGHATLMKGPDALRAAVPVFQPENAVVTKLTQGVRAKFDPRGILNPGLMG